MNTMNKVIFALAAMAASACVDPEPTTFVLVNEGEADVFRNASSSWLGLEVDGQSAMLFEPGCMSKCGALTGQMVCALGAEYPSVHRIAPGQTSEVEWDGVYYTIAEGKNCYREHTAAADFRVTFCYAYEFEPLDGEIADEFDGLIGGAVVKDPVCETTAFERGGDVELIAE